MLFSKSNLAVGRVAAKDTQDQTLNCVHFAADGSTVASNGRSLLAVGPVDESRVHFPPVEGNASPPSAGVSVALDIVDDAVRNLPKDKRMSIQHAKMTRCTEEKVEFTTVSTRKEKRVAGRPRRERFPDWKGIVKKARDGATVGRVCVNRRDLVELLSAMDEAAGEYDEGAVFVEFGGEDNALLFRAVNPRTGQHVVGMTMPMRTGGQWVKTDSWEQEVYKMEIKIRRLARVR